MSNPQNLELGGREVEATVMFTDIAGFSKISEKITPQELTAMLNQYFDGRSDAVRGKEGLPEATLQWLAEGLAATKQPLLWVVGHKPIESLPDMDTARVRHQGESVSANPARVARFLNLLTKHKVKAYICGHTHNASVAKVRGVWQLDAGHAHGAGDTGAPSTFLQVRVSGTCSWVDVYRADSTGANYTLRKVFPLEN